MGITINSTLEEVKAYVETKEFHDQPLDESRKAMDTAVLAAAKNDYSFGISYGREPLGELVFDYMIDLSFKEELDAGSRWSNYVTNYAKITVDGEEYIVAMSWEQAATEMQEHGEAEVFLVKPVERMIVTYERI